MRTLRTLTAGILFGIAIAWAWGARVPRPRHVNGWDEGRPTGIRIVPLDPDETRRAIAGERDLAAAAQS